MSSSKKTFDIPLNSEFGFKIKRVMLLNVECLANVVVLLLFIPCLLLLPLFMGVKC